MEEGHKVVGGDLVETRDGGMKGFGVDGSSGLEITKRKRATLPVESDDALQSIMGADVERG